MPTGPPGGRFVMNDPKADAPLGEGENLDVDTPRRLVQSMRTLWGADIKAEGISWIIWEIESVGDPCRLTVTHDQLHKGSNGQLYGGRPMILAALKTWMETGEKLSTPGSLMYS